MCFARAALMAMLLVWPVPASAAEPPALAEARELYNAGRYDAAIEAATRARAQPQYADAAALIIARAYVERFRQTTDPADLTMARDTFGAIRVSALSPRDEVDLLIGVGQTLYLDETFGAAAELFDAALNRGSLLPPGDRMLLLDWWALALEREAQSRPVDRRAPLFARIAERMEEEVRADPTSAVANYWLVAAARGQGDLDGAWDAAIAAWVRSMLVPETRATLRAEVDRLVTDALIPERARMRPAREQQEAAAALRAEWARVKQQWK